VLAFDDAPLHVDFDHHEVTIDGTPVVLTECSFLAALFHHQGQVVSGTSSSIRPLGTPPSGSASRMVTYSGQRLRRKPRLDKGNDRAIETVRGIGYRYQPGPGAITRRVCAVIVEPEADLLQAPQEMLEPLGLEMGFVAAETCEGLDGFRRIRLAKPSLVVLDAMLPGLDSWQLLARIRGDSDVPVIMLGDEHKKA
jgi:DNA-binding response OmpR family regulator